MSRRARFVVFAVGGGSVAFLFVIAVTGLPRFGQTHHPYRDGAVAASVGRQSANVVSSVNFDQRGLDTFGEETILFGSILGVEALLRRSDDEEVAEDPDQGRTMASTRLAGYLLLPLTLVIGADIIAHGHLTPGGGFQGGIVVATAVHLLYVAGRYPALKRARPLGLMNWGEAFGVASFALVGVAGMLVGGVFLANVVPTGKLGSLLSAGTVPILSGAVGIEVACGVVILLSRFLEQAIELQPARSSP